MFLRPVAFQPQVDNRRFALYMPYREFLDEVTSKNKSKTNGKGRREDAPRIVIGLTTRREDRIISMIWVSKIVAWDGHVWAAGILAPESMSG
jgi:hypothetical protein